MKALQAHHSIVARRRVPAPPPGGSTDYSPYLVEQDFEGSGVDNGESWGGIGSVDPDYTGVVLEGSQSLRINSSSEVLRIWRTIASTDNLTVCAMVRFTTLPPDNNSFMEMWNSGYGASVSIQYSGGFLRAGTGSVSGTGTFAITTGVTYYVWVEYQKGTGSNGVLKVYVSTTTTKPGSPDINITTGDDGSAIEHVVMGHSPAITSDVIYDHVRAVSGVAGTVSDWPL